MAKRGLGKGMSAFLDESSLAVVETSEGVRSIKISDIEPNKNQPRKHFDKEQLELLAESIKEHGIIQPIVLTETPLGYEIVAGERRWRAARLAGLKEIPAIVREYTHQAITEIALIENIQREDLNPIEEASAYRSLMDEFNLTQEEISAKLGKSRSAIANSLRLLSLEPELQQYVISGQISEGHARCVLTLQGTVLREFLINRIIDEGLSVRQTEKLAKDLSTATTKQKKEKRPDETDFQIERIRKSMEERLGTKVTINHKPKKGKIEIEYYGNRDLDRLLDLLGLN
ncbi:MAG: ParB/RepB/Spo0J family partition protein [Eubacteriales bacterium]|nr:ParB/RepB/Spo0J family partition protein [Eubacteriales bacterium]